MDPKSFFSAVQKRLIALIDDRAFRFVGTTRREADQCLAEMKSFLGYSEADVTAAERLFGAPFPRMFRTYLLRMGRASGELFCGSDVARLDALASFRESAIELMDESGVSDALPANAVVFLSHQGYQVLYVLADGADDGPVHVYMEGERAPTVLASSFAAFVEAELGLQEENHRGLRENGGFYLTIQDGRVSKYFPALASGDRAIDGPDRFLP